MRLVERFAVVCVSTTPDFIAPPQSRFNKPVGIGKRLASQAGDVCLALLQDCLGLFESTNTSGSHNRSAESCIIDCPFDGRNQRNAAPKRSGLVGKNCRHTLVAALSGVWIDRLSNFRLLRILKLSALG